MSSNDWEQRKFGEIVQKYEDPVETPAEGYMRLGIRSHAKGTFHSYVEKGKELETAKMFRVAANNFIVNITFGWEHAVAITDESDAGKLVSHRFPQYSFKEGMNPRFFKYLILDECFRHHLELSSPGGAGRNRVLKLNEMLEYKMKFPQMEEQEEIAIYFEQLDNLITLHHRKYMKYADLSVFDWEQRKLSELSEKTFGGGTPKTSNESFWKGNIPWIQSSDLIEGSLFDIEPRKYISQEAVDKSATKLVPENSVAIVTRVGVGKLAFMPFSYATSQDFLSLSVLKTEPQFTVYALYKKLQSELNAVQGTSIKGVTKNELLAKEIMIPCYEEQEKIGSYLHSLDHLITLHQRKCEETKTLKKYMLQKMFPQNGHSVPEIRFSGFTEDWEQRKLGDVFEQTANFVNPNDDDIELWSLTVEDGLTPKSERYNREFLVKKKTNFKEVRPGDIVYNPMNMTLGAVGFNGMAKSVAVSGYYTTMVANKGYDSYYINTWLKSPQAISLYKTFATGSLKEKQRVQFPTLSIIPATFPEHDEQTKIGSYFEHLDHLITLHQHKCEELQNIKKFMLKNMFI